MSNTPPGSMNLPFVIQGNPYYGPSGGIPPAGATHATPSSDPQWQPPHPPVVSSHPAPMYMHYDDYAMGHFPPPPPIPHGHAPPQDHYFGHPPPQPQPQQQLSRSHQRKQTQQQSPNALDPMVEQDIQRGLHVDFYNETDSRLLAAWASFFRDQFLEARNQLAKANYDRNAETYRRTAHFVERVETKIVYTPAVKRLFRQYPLTSMDDPTLVDSMYRTIIDYCSRHPPFDGFTFGSPTWRDYMWFKAGLCKKLDLARKEFLGYYQTQIIELVDNFIQEQGNLGQTQKGHTGEKSVNRDEGDATGRIAQELMNATTAGMKNKASYKRAKQFYALLSRRVIDKMGDAPAKTSSTISGVDKTGEKSTAPPTELVGKRVRDIYSLEEESFILSVLQTHLRDSKDSGTDDIPMSFDDDEGEAMGNICSNATEIAVLLGAQESKKNVHAGVLLFGEESNVHSWEGTPRATALKKTP